MIKEIEIEDLALFGWIQITEVGEENMYFTCEGRQYFVKIG